MTQQTENLINLLAKKSINYYDFITRANNIEEIKELFEPRDFSMWRTLGLSITKLDNGKITLKTRETDISEQTFCIVDIETSGGINNGQIIEIGALKVQNGKTIGEFETLIHAKTIPENICALTGIYPSDLQNAPSLAFALERFRLFLADSIFVAHNVNFDYNFISLSLEKLGFGMLLNRKICTIELARRTIQAQKYGLSSLKELLDINEVHHRAMADSRACFEIFKTSLERIPWTVQSAEDLILFSKTAPSQKIVPKSYI